MGTEKQEKHMVSITFLFEGHEAIWEPSTLLFFWTSGFENFASVPWSFLTRPDAKSHRHSPTAGSNKEQWS
jgi:hypothetical protein